MTPSPLYDFSIIVPTRNRPLKLAKCLESFVGLDYPRDRFEVIVVDDGSDAPLDAVAAPVVAKLKLTLLRQPPSGPGVARNHGAAHARGTYLAFTDDDCAVAPQWLTALKAHFAHSPDDLAGGRMINGLEDNLYSTACHTIIEAAYHYYDPAAGRAHFFPSSNFAMSSARFRALGGFDPHWPLAAAEDREFCYRWLRSGGRMACVPDAAIYHYHVHTLRSYCALHFRYGRGAFRYQSLRSKGQEVGGLKPAWEFYSTCFRLPFRQFATTRAIAIALLLVLWQVTNAAGFFRERFRG